MARLNELKPELSRYDNGSLSIPATLTAAPPPREHRRKSSSNGYEADLVKATTTTAGSRHTKNEFIDHSYVHDSSRRQSGGRSAGQKRSEQQQTQAHQREQPKKPVQRDDFDAEKHTKHKKFWFYDGSIILNVENVLFRVHQTVLSTHCEVFETLFSIPQEASLAEEIIEGLAVVRLAGDKAEDMNDMLHALYFSSHFDQLKVPTAETSAMIKFVSGILRLSTKYINQTLRKKCLSILHSYIPTTLNEFDDRAKIRRFKSDEIMQCILLAQEINVPTILPYLFYCVARVSPQRILRDDPLDISWRDKTICQVGRERLRFAEMSMSHSFLLGFVPSPSCKTIFMCAGARGPHAAWHSLDAASKSSNPLKPFEKWSTLNVCEECIESCKKIHEEGRQGVWDCLPALFEMENWGVLREREAET